MTGTGKAGCKHGVRNSKRSRLSRVREGRIGIGHWICEQRPFLIRTFGQVTLKIDRANGDLMIPAGTLLFTSGKASVGVVRPNGAVEIRTIAISQNWKSRESVGIGSDRRQSAAWPCGWRRLQRPKMKPCTSRQGRQDDLFKENKNFPAGRRG
jgi:hypothetical protein